MKRNAPAASVLCLASLVFALRADDGQIAPADILRNYRAAQAAAPAQAVTMEIDIRASLPGQKKQGRFHALRKINPFGRITYAAARFEGDNSVRNQVIERYLQAESEAQQAAPASVAVTPDNYKFRYKGQSAENGRAVHIFEVTPRHKRKGLFQGEIAIDAATYLPVREAGRLIKSPSIFVRKVAFVRTFDIRGGISVPLQVESVVDTIFGGAQLTVDYSNFALDAGYASVR